MKRTTKRSRQLFLEVLEDRSLPSATTNLINLSGLQVDTSNYSQSDILVQFRNTAPAPQSLLAGTTIGQQLPLVSGLYQVNLSSGVTVAQALAAYGSNPAVLSAEPDYDLTVQGSLNTSSANFQQQWALNNTGQNGGTPGDDIGAEQAWTVTTGSPNVTVAVMDTGIDYNDVDLYDNIWINQAEIPTLPFAPGTGLTGSRYSQLEAVNGGASITFAELNNAADQGLGKITDVNGDGRIDAADILAPMVTVTINGKLYDTGKGGWAYTGNTQDGDTAHPNDFIGWNFVNNTNNPLDDNDHGTVVAGIIGGTGTGGGTLGVAPNASLMAVKFINANGVGSISAFIEGLNYSILHGAKISNNSWSGAASSQDLIDAITNAQNAGQIFVAAAGNSDVDTDVTPAYPSSFNINNIVSVAASTDTDQLASFSNYGVKTVALAAPGVNILSPVPSGSYSNWSGTSMAAPMVSGAMVLVWAEHPTWSYSQVIAQVLDTVTTVPGLQGKTATGGVLDVARAVGAAIQPNYGPQGVGSVWSGPNPNSANSVVVLFTQALNASTITPAAFTLTGPSGQPIAISAVALVAGSNGTKVAVTFANQTAPGTYTLSIGSAVQGTNGTLLRPYTTSFTIPPTTTYTSTAPVPLPAMTKSSSTITVNQNVTVVQVQVVLNINILHDNDLYIHLTSPSGTDILLSNRRGGSGSNYTNTLFTDDATTPISAGAAPFNGSFVAEVPLSYFIGEPAQGVWRLWVEDRGNDSGTLVSWSLKITAASPGGAAPASVLGVGSIASVSEIIAPVPSFGSSAGVVQALGIGMTQTLVSSVGPATQPVLVDRVFAAPGVGDDMRATAWLLRLAGAHDPAGGGDWGAGEESEAEESV